ncbi:MAG: hypothetical protein LBL08_00100 [Candidatus Nomurabacteria bacterium]|jgi:hypothetical protein|nr:hypothetical protein [Candidatus Nomurabacteria bacterium]
MKENIRKIYISRPVSEVFAFTWDSSKLPLWFDAIAEEIPSETSLKLGTTLKNRGYNSEQWNEYKITEFTPNEVTTLSQVGGPYHVRYIYKPYQDGTEFTYHEWVDDGELENQVSQKVLEKLKNVLESNLAKEDVV